MRTSPACVIPSAMLHITDMTYRIGERLLFDQATVAIPAGQKVGLVGQNGAGKSTLLAMITGDLGIEAGNIKVRPTATVGKIAQEAPDGPQSLLQTVIDSHQELVDLQSEAETATDPDRIAYIHTRLADISAHTAEARAAIILSGLGFDAEAQARPCKSFSGGWRMRVALACVLFNEPDLLLLDEPTNYLDLEGVMWLENFLKTYRHTVVIVSHDRDLLNNAVTAIIHLSEGKLTWYTGGYDRFERMRADKMERDMALKTRQEAEKRRIEAFVERFRYQASKAKQAQSRVKMLERMRPIATMVEERTVPFNFPKPEPLSSPLIALEDVSVGYEEDKPILSNLDLRIDMDDRIALLGANGNGKSTFAKMLSERLALQSGKMRKSRVLGVGYFAQHQLDEVPADATPLELMTRLMPDAIEAKVRARLGSFGFGFDKADRHVATLSGGEKARIMFAMATFHAPQLLILDEPTNHLDVDSREALVQAINDYDGAVLLISHDRHLLESCVDRLWIVRDGDVHSYDGDMEDYKRLLLSERGGQKGSNKGNKGEPQKQQDRKSSAEIRLALKPFKEAVKIAEEDISEIEAEKAKYEKALTNPKLYNAPDARTKAKVAFYQKTSARLTAELEEAESDWLDASEALAKQKAALA